MSRAKVGLGEGGLHLMDVLISCITKSRSLYLFFSSCIIFLFSFLAFRFLVQNKIGLWRSVFLNNYYIILTKMTGNIKGIPIFFLYFFRFSFFTHKHQLNAIQQWNGESRANSYTSSTKFSIFYEPNYYC